MAKKIKMRIRVKAHLRRVPTQRGIKKRVIRGHSRYIARDFGGFKRPPSLAEKEQIRQELRDAKSRWKRAVGVEDGEKALEDIVRLRNKLLFDDDNPRNLGAQPQVKEIDEIFRGLKLDRNPRSQEQKFVRDMLKESRKIGPIGPSILATEQDPVLTRKQFREQFLRETQKSNQEAGEALRKKLGLR